MKKITDETITYKNNASVSDTTIFYSRILLQIYYDIFVKSQMEKQAELQLENQQDLLLDLEKLNQK